MKKIILSSIFVTSLSANAFTQLEWTTFINETIITKDDMSWEYDVKKLKEHQTRIKSDDIPILKTIASGDDYQTSQGSKYLLATQGEKSNEFLFNNYLTDEDIKNGLYYLNLNFINTVDKDNLWNIIRTKEEALRVSVKSGFSECSNFKDYHLQGGKDFTFESYDDFFSQRNVIRNYTHSDLFNLELELSEGNYPVTVTFYNNRYVVQSKNDDKCLKIGENEDYKELQKLMALYKQYQKYEYLNETCDDFNNNSLLRTRFNYFCVDAIQSNKEE